jgi:hypothetical protein
MLCACHSVAAISSASVAPSGCFSNSKIRAFLLPSRAVAGLSGDLALFALRTFYRCQHGRLWRYSGRGQALDGFPDSRVCFLAVGELPNRDHAGEAVPDVYQAGHLPATGVGPNLSRW